MKPLTPTHFTIGADMFRHTTLSAADEFHCVRKVAPVVKNTSALMFALADAGEQADEKPDGISRVVGLIEDSAPLIKAFSDLPEADADYIISRCMGVTEMLNGEEWAATWDREAEAPALPNLRMLHLMRICYAVLRDAISVFFSEMLSSLKELGLLRRTIHP